MWGASRVSSASRRSITRSEQPASMSCASRRATATSGKSKYGKRWTTRAVRMAPVRCQRRIAATGTLSSSASIAGVYSRQTRSSSTGSGGMEHSTAMSCRGGKGGPRERERAAKAASLGERPAAVNFLELQRVGLCLSPGRLPTRYPQRATRSRPRDLRQGQALRAASDRRRRRPWLPHRPPSTRQAMSNLRAP